MPRELVVLGCASQVPTRYRNHNGYFLRWDREGVLFDPGEGTQRQMVCAGVPSSAISTICVTHFHGDHCLGLPGVLARLAGDRARQRVDLCYPAAGQVYLDRLRTSSVTDVHADLDLHAVATDGPVPKGGELRLFARRLDHRTDTFGWRLEEPDGRRMKRDVLDRLGIQGPDIGRLAREGTIVVNGTHVALEEVSEHRRGLKVAFVMDTRICDAARELADGVDLLVCESTYLEQDADLANRYAHMTALQAAELARDAGARRLVLTHYSSRYPDASVFADEARTVFAGAVAVNDLDVVPVPRGR